MLQPTEGSIEDNCGKDLPSHLCTICLLWGRTVDIEIVISISAIQVCSLSLTRGFSCTAWLHCTIPSPKPTLVLTLSPVHLHLRNENQSPLPLPLPPPLTPPHPTPPLPTSTLVGLRVCMETSCNVCQICTFNSLPYLLWI